MQKDFNALNNGMLFSILQENNAITKDEYDVQFFTPSTKVLIKEISASTEDNSADLGTSTRGNQSRHQATVSGRKMKQVRSPKEKSSPPLQWADLPHEITANILRGLGAAEKLDTAQKVCTTWHSVCKDPDLWTVIDMLTLDNMLTMCYESYDLEIMCRHAVDRSQGRLVAISVGLFVTNDLLVYIAERSGKLRSLKLESFISVGCDGLIDAIKRLPLLEELELNMIVVSNFNKCIEIVGRSCPLLKSFGFNLNDSRFCKYDYDKNNKDAFAIARSMPDLCHLQLCGNGLTNEGLEAILDGCPHLESLDLGRCFHVKLKGDLGKRLSAQIKYMTYPTPDYELQEDDAESFDGYPYYEDYILP